MTKEKKIGLFLCCVMLFGIIFYKMNYVYFYDQEMERAVREYVFGDGLMPYHRKQPIKGFLKMKDYEHIKTIIIDLKRYDIKDVRDIKKLENVESITLGYGLKKGEDIVYSEMPKNMDAIYSLKHLKQLDLFTMRIDNTFQQGHPTVKELFLNKCIIEDESFLGRFPQVNHLSIDKCEVLSLDFVKDMERLAYLRLSENRYQCTLEPLGSANILLELKIYSGTPEIFVELPEVKTVTELHLKGEAGPDRSQIEPYLEWESIKSIHLNKERYDLETDEWESYQSDGK